MSSTGKLAAGLDDLIPALTELSTALGGESFMRTMMRTVNRVVRVDHWTGFIFHGRAASGFLLTEDRMEPALRRRLAEEYVARYYADDPNFQRVADGRDTPNGTVLSFRPERLPDHYRERFFEQTGLVDKLSCLSFKAGRCVYSNFYRMRPSPPFSPRDLARMRTILPLLGNLIGRIPSSCPNSRAPERPTSRSSRPTNWRCSRRLPPRPWTA